MPTIMTHAAIPLAIGLGMGKKTIPPRLLAAGVVAAMLPDADTLGYHLGVGHASGLYHRGLTHSFVFAAAAALAGALFHKGLRAGFGRTFFFLFLACASHGILDAFTNGGPGVAFLWPYSDARFFIGGHRAIQVAPLGLSRGSMQRLHAVLASELRWVWLPCAIGAAGLCCFRLSVSALWRACFGDKKMSTIAAIGAGKEGAGV